MQGNFYLSEGYMFQCVKYDRYPKFILEEDYIGFKASLYHSLRTSLICILYFIYLFFFDMHSLIHQCDSG